MRGKNRNKSENEAYNVALKIDEWENVRTETELRKYYTHTCLYNVRVCIVLGKYSDELKEIPSLLR